MCVKQKDRAREREREKPVTRIGKIIGGEGVYIEWGDIHDFKKSAQDAGADESPVRKERERVCVGV